MFGRSVLEVRVEMGGTQEPGYVPFRVAVSYPSPPPAINGVSALGLIARGFAVDLLKFDTEDGLWAPGITSLIQDGITRFEETDDTDQYRFLNPSPREAMLTERQSFVDLPEDLDPEQ